MSADTSSEIRGQIVNMVRDFVRREVQPIADRYDNEDIYPHELVGPMREMGLFGITIPEEYGGMGLDYTTFAMIFEELSKGWMSVSGIIGTHHVLAHVVATGGHGGAEAAVPSAPGIWRDQGRPRSHRAGRRKRRAGHPHDRREGW